MLNYPDSVATLLIVKLGLLDRCQKSNLPNHTLPGKKEVDLTLKILIIHNKIWFSKFAKIFSKKRKTSEENQWTKNRIYICFQYFEILFSLTLPRIFSKMFWLRNFFQFFTAPGHNVSRTRATSVPSLPAVPPPVVRSHPTPAPAPGPRS